MECGCMAAITTRMTMCCFCFLFFLQCQWFLRGDVPNATAPQVLGKLRFSVNLHLNFVFASKKLTVKFCGQWNGRACKYEPFRKPHLWDYQINLSSQSAWAPVMRLCQCSTWATLEGWQNMVGGARGWELFHTHPAEAAWAPFLHLSCLAAAVSRSRSWYVWPLSPPRSGNKPLWNQKSSPHEKPVWQEGGAGVGGVAGLHLAQCQLNEAERESLQHVGLVGGGQRLPRFTVEFRRLGAARVKSRCQMSRAWQLNPLSCANPQAAATAGCSVKCAM